MFALYHMYFKNKFKKKANGNNSKNANLNSNKPSWTINALLLKRIIFERKFFLNAKTKQKTQRNQGGYRRNNIPD